MSIICLIVVLPTLKYEFSVRKVTTIFRDTLLKPTPLLIFFPQNIFPFGDIGMEDLLPTLIAKWKIDESLSTSLWCRDPVHHR